MKNTTPNTEHLIIRVAEPKDRETIYRLRHEVYARELGQHQAQRNGALSDGLDAFNTYLIAECHGEIAGFISITPPGFGQFSLDKYVSRADFAAMFADRPFEVRLLTVLRPYRGRPVASLLTYAAFRWVEKNGGNRIIGMGRREVLDLYRKMGMTALEREIESGAARFQLISAEIDELRKVVSTHAGLLNRLERKTDWRLDVPFHEPAKCFHGGSFFQAVGDGFDHLQTRHDIINADVLDAWFPPSPRVIEALHENLGWLLQTSPPTGCEGLVRAIARARGVAPENILPAAGSSDLIFLVLRQWLTPRSRVLLLDPTYGEYAHVLEQVIHCDVERFVLRREEGYQVNLLRLQKHLIQKNFDLVILVNPNSPTGRHVSRVELERMLERVPSQPRVWVDETYMDYAGPGESLETFAAASENVVVCKSMSKVYALSGARAAYLCAAPATIAELRAITPPWAVGLPGQVAAVKALEDPQYYAARHAETHQLRRTLAAELAKFRGWEVLPGVANYLLCHLPEDGPEASEIVRRCRACGLYLRDAAAMGSGLGRHALRIAVKDAPTNHRMVAILRRVLSENTFINAEDSPPLAQRNDACNPSPASQVARLQM